MKSMVWSAVALSAAFFVYAAWQISAEPAVLSRNMPSEAAGDLSAMSQHQAKNGTDERDSSAFPDGAIDQEIAVLFTPESFELGRVLVLIEAADIGEQQKAALKATLESSLENPEFLEQTLQAAKSALGY